jgi:hypothetical protein
MTSQRLIRLAPALLWFAVLAVGYVLILKLNDPGHMSVDSVISLAEGRRGVRIVFGPPMYSSILGFFDRITPSSPVAYMTGAAGLLALSWAAMPALRGRIAWLAPVVLAAAMLAPQVLLYQAIMWKDVLFANFAIAGFVALAHAVRRWERMGARLLLLFVAFLLLGMACLLRQNGALVAVFSAATLGWTAWKSGWRKALGWAVVGFAAPLVFMTVLDAVTPVKDPPGENRDVGLRLLQGYDLAGAIAADPNRPLRALEADNPRAAADLRQEAPKYYSATRVDALLGSKTLGKAITSYSDGVIAEQWVQTLTEDPVGYATRRFDVFRWVFATPDIDKCLPIHLGVDGPPKLMNELGLKTRLDSEDRRLWNYTTWWMDTPGLSHPAFAVLALAVTGFLLLRREAADIAIAGLMLSALSFAASFYVISLACDYRYLYFLDLAALTGAVYVALDPRLRRRSA